MNVQSAELEHGSGHQCWELRASDAGWFQLGFTEGTVITEELVQDIAEHLLEIQAKNPIHLLILIAGISDVRPEASTRLAASHPSTRLALLGSSHMDQVLAGFMICDLKNPQIAKYVTSVAEAEEHFRTL